MKEGRTMMLLRNITYWLRQLIFLLHFGTVTRVRNDNGFTQFRIDKIMRVLNIVLVLNKIAWPLCFSDIVII
ncbi:hypothetical protein D3C81_2292580 [compost metagenome]